MTTRIRPKFARVIRIYGSDLVHTVRYDPATNILDIRTKSGKAYRYHNIYNSTFTALVTEKSPGKVFNREVKIGKYSGLPTKSTKLRFTVW